MSDLFADGGIIFLVLGFMAVEAMVLILVRMQCLRAIPPLELVVSMGAGAALLGALREALRGAAWQDIAIWLIVSLGCHLWDLKLRWAASRTR